MVKKQSLYICSTSGFCGKSIICLGLALNLQDAGYKVGYLKPLGWEMKRGSKGEKIDEDAQLMAAILDLRLPLDSVVPIIVGSRFFEEIDKSDINSYEEKILKAYWKIAQDNDMIIIEGPNSLGIGNSMGIDPISLSKKLKSRILMVSTFHNDVTIDRNTWVKRVIEALGCSYVGLILNRVPRTDVGRVKRFVPPVLEKHGIDLFGIIPEDVEILAPTVREVCETVTCEILTAENKLDNLIEDILVGAMSPEVALTYFRRSSRKAVITGGDRTDVQLAALETNLSVLILTGNIYPDVRVLSRAEELDVPVLLVPWDTYNTVRRLSNLTGRINPKDNKKIALAKKLVMENVEWKRIFNI